MKKTMKKTVALIPLLTLGLLTSPFLHAEENLLVNPGLEDDIEGWGIFLPEGSEDKDATMSVSPKAAHSGSNGMVMSCSESIRYAVSTRRKEGSKGSPGERFRVSVWVRAGKDFVQNPKTPGFYIRVTLHSAPAVPVTSGHQHFGLGDFASRGRPPLGTPEVPKTWTKIEATFEVPEETTSMSVDLMVHEGSGDFYIDDFSLKKVPDSTPLTPLED